MAELIRKDKLIDWTYRVPQYYDSMNDRTDMRDFINGLPTTTEAEIRAKAKRELAEQIEKRIKEEVALLVSEREDAREYDDEQVIFAVNNQLRAFDYSLRVVAEHLKEEQ